jgi:hypothetical protein
LFSNIFRFTTSRVYPRTLSTGILRFFLLVRSLIKAPIQIDLDRLSLAINFPRRDIQAGSFDKSIELVFVAIKKDFPILVHSIIYAKKSIGKYRFGGIKVIVPDAEVDECVTLLSGMGIENFCVIPESTLITTKSLEMLRETFNSRANWVLQQILKVQAVLVSAADATLIVDSDTLLLSKRPWFGIDGRQLLTPSYEYNAPYYEFLANLHISTPRPQYTFISHHMLMQRGELAKTLKELDWNDVEEMVEYLSLIHI